MIFMIIIQIILIILIMIHLLHFIQYLIKNVLQIMNFFQTYFKYKLLIIINIITHEFAMRKSYLLYYFSKYEFDFFLLRLNFIGSKCKLVLIFGSFNGVEHYISKSFYLAI